METSQPSCFNLLTKPFRKLKTKRPTSDLPLDNKFASSSDYVNCEVVSQTNEALDLLPIGNNTNELMEEVNAENIEDELMEDVNDGYEVFLSFRGADVRINFVSHLYKELKTKGIHTFMDERKLKKGKPLSFLLKVIKKCEIVIVVFSPDYASSSWCLDELVEVVKCMKSEKQIVIPIFYNLDLDQETAFYSKALENHQKVFENEKIENWISALSTVAEIAGWDSRKSRNDATLIEDVVRDVSDRLISKSSNLGTRLVGIDSLLTSLDEKLGLECDDVRMIGIWGPGGVGKTTIADFIYHRETRNYDKCCRIKNIKDKFAKEGAVALQKQLLSQILLEKDLDIWDEDVGCDLICRRLRHIKVLIVLDDVNELEQLKVLAKDVQSFGQRSRIIITTRNKRLLEEHGVKHIYEVPFLEGNKALQLFSLHAFKENQPSNDFLELSNKVISHAQGLPLALEILGRSLYKRDEGFWESELKKLKRIPNNEISQILRTSYDGLDDSVKRVFLDIAFFFNGMLRVTVENVLDGGNFYPKSALPILEERALITISDDNRLNMHDLIQTMGYKIVREGKNYPNECNRICHPEDVSYVLTNFEGGTSIEGISLNMNELRESVYLKPNAFEKMIHLRILKIFHNYNNRLIEQPEIHCLEGLGSLPKELRYFHWDCFPLQSLPFSSFGENLVELLLGRSKLEYLWEGEMEFKNLKKIDLSKNYSLKALPDLSKVLNIEEIILDGCFNCYEFPSDLRDLQKLKILNFDGCFKLDKLPMLPSSLVEFYLSSTPVRKLSPGFQFLAKLKILNLNFSMELTLTRFTEFPQCIGELKSLKYLTLSHVPIAELPESIEHLHELKKLHLNFCTSLVSLPSCMHKLASLKDIEIGDCKSLVSLPKLPPSLKRLSAECCESLETLECNDWNHFRRLRYLVFAGCNKLDDRSCNDIMECARVISHRYREDRLPIDFVLPRMEIPEWFDYKSCESSIVVQLPLSPYQIRGFVFCIAYTCLDSSLRSNSGSFTVKTDLINLDDVFSKVEIWLSGPMCVDQVAVSEYRFDDAEKEVLMEYLGCELQFNISYHRYTYDEEYKKVKEPNVVLKQWGVHLIPEEEVNLI